MTAADVKRQFRELPYDERVALVHELLMELQAEVTGPPETEALKAELDRRWAEHLADPDSALSWSEVKRQIFEKIGR